DWTRERVRPPAELVAAAQAEMGGASLLWVHLTAVDDAGHRAGAAAPGYRDAARAADDEGRAIATARGWPAAAVVVFADHGQPRPRGGHGGDERDVVRSFLYASGPGVRAGARVAGARMIDLAPTLAALTGTRAPAQAEGRTLTELLDIGSGPRRALIVA